MRAPVVVCAAVALALLVCPARAAATSSNETVQCDDHLNRCQHGGICLDGSICECRPRYVGALCERKLKSKLVAFLLQLLVGPLFGLPPGAGMFYIGRGDLAVPQLVLGLVPSAILWAFFCCACFGGCAAGICIGLGDCDPEVGAGVFGAISGALGFVVSCIAGLLALAASIMWLYCWITILTDAMEDGHGNALYNDM